MLLLPLKYETNFKGLRAEILPLVESKQSAAYIREVRNCLTVPCTILSIITSVHFITIKSGLHTPTDECQITVRFKGHSRILGPLTVELALFRASGAQVGAHKFWGHL